jgi:hypothetical protein
MQPLPVRVQVREKLELPLELELGGAGGKDLEHRRELERDSSLGLVEGQIGLRGKVPEFAKGLLDKISRHIWCPDLSTPM